jgi:hypothetical protein
LRADDLVGSRLGSGMHAVLRYFVEATGWWLDFVTIEMVEGHSAFADGVALLDGFRYVSLSEGGGLEKRTTSA